jgi:hypothetical protein
MALTIAVVSTQAMGVALATNVGAAATIEIRSGAKPATPETAATGTLLATVAISGSFTSTAGVLTSADPASVAPAASGTAAHFRLKQSGGTAVLDGTVTATGGGGDMQLGSTTITTGVNVDLGVPTITIPVA